MPPYIYIAATNEDSLTIVDIANPVAPVTVGNLVGAGAPNYLEDIRGVYVRGDTAFVVSSTDSALVAIAVVDPINPALISVAGLGVLNQPQNVFVSGSYAYVVSQTDDFLYIYDISDLSNMILVGSIGGSGAPNFLDTPQDVVVRGNYAYVTSFGDDSLTIINVTDPTNPIFEGNIAGAGAPNWLNGARCVRLNGAGAVAFVTASTDDSFGAFDITNPAIPTLLNSIQGAGIAPFLNGARYFVIDGTYAYIAAYTEQRFTIIDITNPAALAYTGSVSVAPDSAEDAYVLGTNAFIAAYGIPGALYTIDIAVPAVPVVTNIFAGAGAPNWMLSPVRVRPSVIGFPSVRTDPATEVR